MQNLKSATLKKIVLIGASTGGPGQIQKIIQALPQLHETSVVIAQHMVVGFLESFALQLQNKTKNKISIIQDALHMESETLYIAECMSIIDANKLVFRKTQIEHNSYNPNIDLLFKSFLPHAQEFQILCVILTGIGSDGVEAASDLSSVGAICMTESSKSAIVDGMPSRARAMVPNIQVHNFEDIIHKIVEFCNV